MRTPQHAHSKKTNVLTVSFIILFLAMHACAGNYGHLRPDSEARQAFESHRVLPDHNYYYSGSSSKPRAILGIQKDYRLETKLWKSVDLTSEQLKSWIDNMAPSLGRSINNWGSVIVDHNGKTVGVWYSRHRQTTVELKDNNGIVVHTPKDDSEYPFRKLSDR